MTQEAKLERDGEVLKPKGEGWYVINLADCPWLKAEGPFPGASSVLEGELAWGPGVTPRFHEFGVNVRVLVPGGPSCMYHSETVEEAFLVLQGECLLLIEEEERPLKTWDFVHCPPGTRHVFVGAGEGPCALLQIGTRSKDKKITYPVSELAAKHGCSVKAETHDPREAYADVPGFEVGKGSWPLP